MHEILGLEPFGVQCPFSIVLRILVNTLWSRHTPYVLLTYGVQILGIYMYSSLAIAKLKREGNLSRIEHLPFSFITDGVAECKF